MMEPNYLNVRQLSVYSGLGVRTLRDLMKDTEHPLPHFRVGQRTIRVSKSDFDRWMAQYHVDSTNKIKALVDSVVKDFINN